MPVPCPPCPAAADTAAMYSPYCLTQVRAGGAGPVPGKAGPVPGLGGRRYRGAGIRLRGALPSAIVLSGMGALGSDFGAGGTAAPFQRSVPAGIPQVAEAAGRWGTAVWGRRDLVGGHRAPFRSASRCSSVISCPGGAAVAPGTSASLTGGAERLRCCPVNDGAPRFRFLAAVFFFGGGGGGASGS